MIFNEEQFKQALEISNKEGVSACLNDLLQERSWVNFSRALVIASESKAADLMADVVIQLDGTSQQVLTQVRQCETPLSLSLSARPVSVTIVKALLRLSYTENVLELVHPGGNLLDLAVATGLVEVVVGVCDLLKTVDGLFDDLVDFRSWLSKTENSGVICGVFDRANDAFVMASTQLDLLKIARAIFFDGALASDGSNRIDRLFKKKSFSRETLRLEFVRVLNLQIGAADLELFLGDSPKNLFKIFFSVDNTQPKDFFNFFDFFLERKKTEASASVVGAVFNYGAFLHCLSQLSVELFSALIKREGALIRLDLRWNQGATLAAQILLDGNIEKFEALCEVADPAALRSAMSQPYVSTDRRKTGLYPEGGVADGGSYLRLAMFDLVRSQKPIITIFSKAQATLLNWNQFDGEGLSFVTVAARANNAPAFRWCMDYFLDDIERSGDDDFLYQAVKHSRHAVLDVLKEYWPRLSDTLKVRLLEYAEGLDTPASFAIENNDLGTLYWLLKVSVGLVGHDEYRYAEELRLDKPGGLCELIAANNEDALAYFLGCAVYEEYVVRALSCEVCLIRDPNLGPKAPASWVKYFSRTFSVDHFRQQKVCSMQSQLRGAVGCIPQKPVVFLESYLYERGQFKVDAFKAVVEARSFINIGPGIKFAQSLKQALLVQQYFESLPNNSDFGVLSQYLADDSFVVDLGILGVLLAKGLKCGASFCFKVIARGLLKHIEVLRGASQDLTRPYRGRLPLFEAVSSKCVEVVKLLAALITYRVGDLQLIDLKIKRNIFEEALATGEVKIVRPVWECLARYQTLGHFVNSRAWLDQVVDPMVICFIVSQLDESLIQLLLPTDELKVFEAIFLTGDLECFDRFVKVQMLDDAHVLRQCGAVLNRHVPVADYTKVLSNVNEFFISSAILRRDGVTFNNYLDRLSLKVDLGYFFFASLFTLKVEQHIPIQQYFFDQFLMVETVSNFMAQLSVVGRQQLWGGIFWYGARVHVEALKKRWALEEAEVLKCAQAFFDEKFSLGMSSYVLPSVDELFIYGYGARGLVVEFERGVGYASVEIQAHKNFDLAALLFSVVGGCCEPSIFSRLLDIEHGLFNEERGEIFVPQESDKKTFSTIGPSPPSSAGIKKPSVRQGTFYHADPMDRVDFIFHELSGHGPQGAFQAIHDRLDEVLSFFTSETAVHNIMLQGGVESKAAVLEFLNEAQKSRLPPFVVLKALACLQGLSLVVWRKDAASNLILYQQYRYLADSQVVHVLEADYSLERVTFEGDPALDELLEYHLIPPARSEDTECISPHRLLEVLPSRSALDRHGKSLLRCLVEKIQSSDCSDNARACLPFLLRARTDSLYYNFKLKELLSLLEDQKRRGDSLVTSYLSLTAMALAYDQLSKGLADCLVVSCSEFKELDQFKSSFYVLYLNSILKSGSLISTELYKVFQSTKLLADDVLASAKAEIEKIKDLRKILKNLGKGCPQFEFFFHKTAKQIGESWIVAADAKIFFEGVVSVRLKEPLKALDFLSRQEFLLTQEARDSLRRVRGESSEGFSQTNSFLLRTLFSGVLSEVQKECVRGLLKSVSLVQSMALDERADEIQRQVAYLSNVAKIDRRVLVPSLIEGLKLLIVDLQVSEEIVWVCQAFIDVLVARQYYDPSNDRTFLNWRAMGDDNFSTRLRGLMEQGSQALLSWLRSLSPDYCKEALEVCLKLAARDTQLLQQRLQEMFQANRKEVVGAQQQKIANLSLLRQKLQMYKQNQSASGVFSFYGEGLAAKQSWLMGLKVLLDGDNVQASWRAIRSIIEQHSPAYGDWGARTEALVLLFRDCSALIEWAELFYQQSPGMIEDHLQQLGYPSEMMCRIKQWCIPQEDDWDRQVLNQSLTRINPSGVSGSPSRRGVGVRDSLGSVRTGSQTPSRSGSFYCEDYFGDDAMLHLFDEDSTPSSSGQRGDDFRRFSYDDGHLSPRVPPSVNSPAERGGGRPGNKPFLTFSLTGQANYLQKRHQELPDLAKISQLVGSDDLGSQDSDAGEEVCNKNNLSPR